MPCMDEESPDPDESLVSENNDCSNDDAQSEFDDEPFLEVDPIGRYGRYADLLGTGSTKKVYRGFDLEEGLEVAWNQIHLKDFVNDPSVLDRLYSEVRLLRELHHENIIKLYNYWTDVEHNNFNFITEICTSGSLRGYRSRHKHVSTKALKKWSRQILRGLDYLHNHEPCVIHRDLNCSNVFINGNTGEVMIGDFGLAVTMTMGSSVHTVVGTPEFMAPEQFNENYTEGVDIYSFGMCVLELVTTEIPYSECDNLPKIYKRVTTGIRPIALKKVMDPEVKAFINKCIAPYKDRPTASELLEDPFFQGLDDDDNDDDDVKNNYSC